NAGEAATGANDVSRNAGELARGVKEITSNIRGVSEAAHDNTSSAQKVNAAARKLAAIAADLQRLVGRFQTEAAGAGVGAFGGGSCRAGDDRPRLTEDQPGTVVPGSEARRRPRAPGNSPSRLIRPCPLARRERG